MIRVSYTKKQDTDILQLNQTIWIFKNTFSCIYLLASENITVCLCIWSSYASWNIFLNIWSVSAIQWTCQRNGTTLGLCDYWKQGNKMWRIQYEVLHLYALKIFAKYLTMLYVRLTIGLAGILILWIFGEPYKRRGFESWGTRITYVSFEILENFTGEVMSRSNLAIFELSWHIKIKPIDGVVVNILLTWSLK